MSKTRKEQIAELQQDSLNTYLTTFPNGRWIQDAIQLRQQLAPGQQGYQFNLGGLNIRLLPGN